MAVKKTHRKQVNLFGIQFDAVTREYMVERVDEAIANTQPIWLTFINVAILVKATRDSEARHILEVADYRLCDGMGLVYASHLLGKPLPEMVSGPYLFFRLLQHAADHGYGVYLLGSKPEVIEKAVANISCAYPSIKIAGYRDGYYSPVEVNSVVKHIRQSGAQFLFVGMGFPRERLFLKEHRYYLNVPVCMDVGGAFTVLAGVHRLAPQWMRVVGIEWLYRMLQEPRRLWRRYLVTNVLFGWLVIREALRRAK